ncbi:hypothetical protein MNB_SV-13-1662 [hydrothermal vent metagenome]|uniref:Uncharacterized protein n=1 Tax=hydrothermal vent metagenome TaxID=652676 RepID=A0A1W1CDB9_9ZZZZ
MTKKLLTTLAVFLVLLVPVQSFAEESSETKTEWVEESMDFGTDSYDEDGCFC